MSLKSSVWIQVVSWAVTESAKMKKQSASNILFMAKSIVDHKDKLHNITPYSEGLEQLLFINPVNFQYNKLAGTYTKKEYVGVIAKELKEVVPYMVCTFEMDNTQYYDVGNSAMMYICLLMRWRNWMLIKKSNR